MMDGLKSEFPVQGQLNGTKVFEAAVVFVFAKYFKKKKYLVRVFIR